MLCRPARDRSRPHICQETNEQGSNHGDPQLRTSPTSLNFRIFSRNQPKGPASQPASQSTPESRNVLPMVAAFFFLSHDLLDVRSFTTSSLDRRWTRLSCARPEQMQQRTTPPALCLVAVSAPRPHASLSPPFASPPVPRHADCERGVVAGMRYRCSEWASRSKRVCSCSEAAGQHMKETEMVWGARHSRATSRQSCAVIKYLYRSHSLRCLLLSAAALRV